MDPTNQGEAGQEVAKLSQVIQIDEGKIQAHLGEVVRSTVEETLNALLDAEADRLCRAERYERTEARQDTRAGSYQRQLHTKVKQAQERSSSWAGMGIDLGQSYMAKPGGSRRSNPARRSYASTNVRKILDTTRKNLSLDLRPTWLAREAKQESFVTSRASGYLFPTSVWG